MGNRYVIDNQHVVRRFLESAFNHLRKSTSLVVSLVTFAMLFVVSGCQREKVPGGASSIVIQAPSVQKASSVGSMSAIPTNRKACYGVSVTAPDISSQASECSPTTGIVGGFVESGGLLELTIPKGSDRKIDLYLYLMAEGESGACPQMGQNLGGANLPKTYLIGSVGGVSLQNEVESVSITATFPGLNNHLAQQFTLPASCAPTPNPNNMTSSHVTAAQGIATGTGIKLIGTVGRANSAPIATGTGYKLKVRSIER